MKLEPWRERRASGEGESLGNGDEEPWEGVTVAVFLSWDERERPGLAFNPDVFGVDAFGGDFLGV